MLETDFVSWLDRVLREHASAGVVAYNFNLYEHDDAFAVQVVGASRFDADDPTWACEEVFSSGEDLFPLPHSLVGEDWEDGLAAAKALVTKYLEAGAEARTLTSAKGIGVGFVDGDVELIGALGT
jgi:hypothetical protein